MHVILTRQKYMQCEKFGKLEKYTHSIAAVYRYYCVYMYLLLRFVMARGNKIVLLCDIKTEHEEERAH